jgi:transcription elongation factor GreA-like protein
METLLTERIVSGVDPAADAVASAKLDPQVKLLLDAARPEVVEELMLNRIESDPFNFTFIVPVIRAFVRSKRFDSAGTFLELLLDACRSRKAKREEAMLLRALLSIWPESPVVKKGILDLLSERFGKSPNYRRLLDHCRISDSPDQPAALRKLELWLIYDEGRGVYFPARGLGRVREINPGLDAVRVAFVNGNETLSFKLDEANRNLEVLPHGHFLLDKLDKNPELTELAANDKGELLRRLFNSVKRDLTVNELRDMVSGLVTDAQWTMWWGEARRDRRLTVSKDTCTWNDSGDDADRELLRQFMTVPVRDQIDMAKKYAKRSETLAAAMTLQLLTAAESRMTEYQGLTLELLLSLDKLAVKDAPQVAKNIELLISRIDIPELIIGIPDRLVRKKAITLLRNQRPDWASLFPVLLRKESDNGSITFMYDALRAGNAAQADELVREIFQSPVTSPHLFVWLSQEIPRRIELQSFANWSYIQTVIQLLAKDTMKEKNPSLKKLFDGDGAVCFAARKLDIEQVKQFMTLLERDSSLEDYRREKMRGDLLAWYPQTEEIKDHG